MNPILFPAFLDEALGLLPRLRRTLLRFASGECPVSEIQTSASSVSSLAKSANLLGLAEIAEASHLLESLLFDISKAANPNLEKINNTLDQITHLETILLNETFGNDKDSKEIESYLDDKVAILINEKSDTYQTSYENPTEPKGIAEFKTIDKDFVPGQLHIHEHENSHSDYLKPEDFQTGSFQTEGFQSSGFQSSLEADSFEVDDELQEVFAEEANQLLNDIENALEKLRIDSGNRELLWETRRAAHTLKGSAGIVGFKAVSELSHRVEDLLEAMAERGIEASQSLLDLIAESTNALRALASNGQSETLTDIAELYSKFDQALEQISNTFAEPPPSESNSQIVENIFNNLESGPISTHKQSEPAVDNSCEDFAERFSELASPIVSIPSFNESRAIVRVSLSRLDELVSAVRGLVITRSSLENRLKDLERQVSELSNAARRLQMTGTKFEVDFGSALLGAAALTKGITNNSGFDELELDRYTEFHQTSRVLNETTADTVSIETALDKIHSELNVLFSRQSKLINELQERLMRIRMVEFYSLSTRLQRMVRSTCDETGKKAMLHLQNENVELDTRILDSLVEPLLHLVKNAVVHGIEPPEIRKLLGKPETGNIKISIENEDTHIRLIVEDDGRGISTDLLKQRAVDFGLLSADKASALSEEQALKLIFLPRVTTAEKVDLNAGRGLGMSIVQDSISACFGSISVESSFQKGTRFTIRLPLTLGIAKVLIASVNNHRVAIPLRSIEMICDEKNIDSFGNQNENAEDIPKQNPILLSDLIGTVVEASPNKDDSFDECTTAIIRCNSQQYSIRLGKVLGVEEVLIRALGRPLDKIQGLVGAAALGDGELVPILDLAQLLKQTFVNKPQPAVIKSTLTKLRVMIVDDSPSVRLMTRKYVEAAGWEAILARDGLEALQLIKSSSLLPNVILSDIEMPRMDGFEFAASLRQSAAFSNIPIIMITSRSAQKHRERAAEYGITEYITKPFDDRILAETIKRITARS